MASVSHPSNEREDVPHVRAGERITKMPIRNKRCGTTTAQDCDFDPGYLVLVLPSNKLLERWQGQYKVVKRVGQVDYLIDMHE